MPFALLGLGKDFYFSVNESLFFRGLFNIIFGTYFALVLVAILNLTSPINDINHNFVSLSLSWGIIIFCVVFVPLIIIYAAFVPKNLRNAKFY